MTDQQIRAHYDPCPHPEKVGYRMRWHALYAADKLRAVGLYDTEPYGCRCGRYHLTTKKQQPKGTTS